MNIESPPEADGDDFLHKIISTIIGVIPGGGSFLRSLFETAIPTSLEKRQKIWFNKVAGELDKIQTEITIIDLKNEEFISYFLESTQIALKTSQENKVKRIANSVRNAILPNSPDETYKTIFLDFINRFSDEHFWILELLKNRKWIKYGLSENPRAINPSYTVTNDNEIFTNYPQFYKNSELYKYIVNVLEQSSLIQKEKDEQDVNINNRNYDYIKITNMGRRFLDFIDDFKS